MTAVHQDQTMLESGQLGTLLSVVPWLPDRGLGPRRQAANRVHTGPEGGEALSLDTECSRWGPADVSGTDERCGARWNRSSHRLFGPQC